jgi:BirA family biotin operon repressor/biotin-[acetyl-CoA-carboxylase] ligase
MPHKFSTNYTNRTKALARVLRKSENEPEAKLWNKVRGRQLGVRFRRQVPIGKFVVDFASLEIKLIVEIDGIQHQSDTGRRADAIRDAFLCENSFRVMRFSNDDVHSNVEDVADQILATIQELKKQRPHPNLPLSGEER